LFYGRLAYWQRLLTHYRYRGYVMRLPALPFSGDLRLISLIAFGHYLTV
jgi:hypothetical protein